MTTEEGETMPEEPAKTAERQPMRDIVIPLAVVIGLIGNAWWGGVGWGRVNGKLDTIVDSIRSTQGEVSQLRNDALEIDRKLAALESRMKQQEDAFRLFKMYTKGRIARLPYRATDDGE